MDVYFERIAGVADTRPQETHGPAPVTSTVREDSLDANGFPLSPLKDQDHLWFVQAARLHRPLAAGSAMARASGMSLMIFGLATALAGGLGLTAGGSPVPLVLGLVLATLGGIERGGATALAMADPAAPGKLARNQIILFSLMAAATYTSGLNKLTVPDAQALSTLPPELSAPMSAMGPVLHQGLMVVVLGTLLLVQGSLAMYYLSRRKHVREFHSELPPWVARVVTTVSGR